MLNEAVSSIMTSPVLTVSPTDKVQKVYDLMVINKVHHVPVVNEANILLGIVTTYDLVKNNVNQESLNNVDVADIMTIKVATLEPTAKIGTAAEIFLEHRFHALPIVLESKELVGIVTTHDVLKYEFRKEYPNNPW